MSEKNADLKFKRFKKELFDFKNIIYFIPENVYSDRKSFIWRYKTKEIATNIVNIEKS